MVTAGSAAAPGWEQRCDQCLSMKEMVLGFNTAKSLLMPLIRRQNCVQSAEQTSKLRTIGGADFETLYNRPSRRRNFVQSAEQAPKLRTIGREDVKIAHIRWLVEQELCRLHSLSCQCTVISCNTENDVTQCRQWRQNWYTLNADAIDLCQIHQICC